MTAGRTEILVKSFVAESPIPRNRFIKVGTTAGGILLATAATDLIIGISSDVVDADTGDFADGNLIGVSNIKVGGTIAYGARVTSDSTGRAITAVGTVRVGGIAMAAGVLNDIIPVLISLSQLVAPAA